MTIPATTWSGSLYPMPDELGDGVLTDPTQDGAVTVYPQDGAVTSVQVWTPTAGPSASWSSPSAPSASWVTL